MPTFFSSGSLAGFVFEKRYFGDIMSRFEGAEAIQRTLTNNFIEALLDAGFYLCACGHVLLQPQADADCNDQRGSLRGFAQFCLSPLRRSMEEQIISLSKQQTFSLRPARHPHD